MATLCEQCGKSESVKGYRFCKECKKAMLAEMKNSGYLAPRPIGHVGDNRTAEMKEVQHETRSGTGHG